MVQHLMPCAKYRSVFRYPPTREHDLICESWFLESIGSNPFSALFYSALMIEMYIFIEMKLMVFNLYTISM